MESTALFELAAFHAGGEGYIATADIPVKGVVSRLDGSVCVDAPDKYTIQVGVERHIDVDEVRYLNHSCQPNTYVDTVANEVVAIEPITKGSALTFFYPSTEWEMAAPFDCQCGSVGCLGKIAGAAALSDDVLEGYALNPHIRTLLDQRATPAAQAAQAE